MSEKKTKCKHLWAVRDRSVKRDVDFDIIYDADGNATSYTTYHCQHCLETKAVED